jgi:hypothetical protein
MTKNKFSIIFLGGILLLGLLLPGYDRGGSFANDNSSKSINDLLEYFSENFSVTNKSEKFFEMIGAIDGCGVNLNGFSIEIYKFDIKDQGQKTIIENAQQTHTMSIFGTTFPVLVNGSFVICSYTGHPERTKIIEIFEEF